MIKLENTVLANPELMKSLVWYLTDNTISHRKFMSMMPVRVKITAPMYWWDEFDTYKVDRIVNSCDIMRKIQEKGFTLEDFSHEHLTPRFRDQLRDVLNELNYLRDKYNYFEEEKAMNMRGGYVFDSKKDIWWQIIQLLPSSYNQTSVVKMKYEALAKIYKTHKDDKLDEWREFCKWIETLPYSTLITGEHVKPDNTRGTGLRQPGDED